MVMNYQMCTKCELKIIAGGFEKVGLNSLAQRGCRTFHVKSVKKIAQRGCEIVRVKGPKSEAVEPRFSPKNHVGKLPKLRQIVNHTLLYEVIPTFFTQ